MKKLLMLIIQKYIDSPKNLFPALLSKLKIIGPETNLYLSSIEKG